MVVLVLLMVYGDVSVSNGVYVWRAQNISLLISFIAFTVWELEDCQMWIHLLSVWVEDI